MAQTFAAMVQIIKVMLVAAIIKVITIRLKSVSKGILLQAVLAWWVRIMMTHCLRMRHIEATTATLIFH
jgi:hypothetical protein